MSEETGFEDKPLKELIEEYLWTDEGMFGGIVFDARIELERRYPPPSWATRFYKRNEFGDWEHI